MTLIEKINKACNFFFFTGFVISKLQFLPIPMISLITKSVSLSMYFLGYILWYISTYFHSNDPMIKPEWYEFAKTHELYRYSAILGIISTVLGISGIFSPFIALPAAWLFFISNFIWAMGEYQVLHHPPLNNLSYSHAGQYKYVEYANAMTIIALITASTCTFALLYPAFAVPVLLTSSMISTGIGFAALESWLEYHYGHIPPDIKPESYQLLQQKLGANVNNTVDKQIQPVEHHQLFANKENIDKASRLGLGPTINVTINV